MSADPLDQMMALVWLLTFGKPQPKALPVPAAPVVDAATQAEQRRLEREREDYRARRAIQKCPACDSNGWLDWSARGGVSFRCPHDPALFREAHDAREAELQAAQEAWEIKHQQDAPRRDFTHATDK